MKFRTTIVQLMGLVAFVALGIAAIRSNDPLPTALLLPATIGLLCLATLFAIYRRGGWAGFAIFGWAWFLVSQPHNAPGVGPTPAPLMAVYEVISHLSDPARFSLPISRFPGFPSRSPGYLAVVAERDGTPYLGQVSGNGTIIRGKVPINSLRSGLCMLSLVAGAIGAVIGTIIDRKEKRESSDLSRT